MSSIALIPNDLWLFGVPHVSILLCPLVLLVRHLRNLLGMKKRNTGRGEEKEGVHEVSFFSKCKALELKEDSKLMCHHLLSLE